MAGLLQSQNTDMFMMSEEFSTHVHEVQIHLESSV